MELKTNSTAGTMESSDIMIMLEPRTEGGIELAEEVVRLCERPNDFTFSYELSGSIEEKIEAIVKKIYGGDGVEFSVGLHRSRPHRCRNLPCGSAQRLPLGSLNGFILGRKDAFAEQSIETFNILMRNKAAAKADIRKCTLKIV